MWPNLQETVDLVTFTEEIHNEQVHFLCSVETNHSCRNYKWLVESLITNLKYALKISKDKLITNLPYNGKWHQE